MGQQPSTMAADGTTPTEWSLGADGQAAAGGAHPHTAGPGGVSAASQSSSYRQPAGPTTSALPLAPPSVAKMLPTRTSADTTMAYLSQLIAQTEENARRGVASHHDIALMRYQLQTITEQATRRREDQHQLMQRQFEEERRRDHAMSTPTQTMSPQPPEPKKLMMQHPSHPEQDDLLYPTQHPQPPSQQSIEDELLNQQEDPIALIGLHQAQIHAANMAMIRQAQQQQAGLPQDDMSCQQSQDSSQDLLRQQSSDPQPWYSDLQQQTPLSQLRTLTSPLSQLRTLVSPLSQHRTLGSPSSDWPMDASNPPSDYPTQYAESFALDTPSVPLSPFMPLRDALDDDLRAQEPPSNQPHVLESPPSAGVQSTTEAITERPSSTCGAAEDDDAHSQAGSAASNGSSGASIDSSGGPRMLADYIRADRSNASKVFLNNFQGLDVLSTLEREYAAGNFSAAGLRQCLMWMASSLEAEDQDAFLDQFSQMSLAGCRHVLDTCPHVDMQPVPGVPCCPQHAGVGSSSHRLAKAREAVHSLGHHWTAKDSAKAAGISLESGVPFAAAMATTMSLDHTEALSAVFGHDLSPQEAAPDDTDGVARMRMTLIFAVPKAPPKKSKRKKTTDDEEPLSPISSVVSSRAEASAARPAESASIHRMIQVNKAFERMSGTTQANICAHVLLRASPIGSFDGVRSDHVRACHRIMTRWRLNNVTEGHLSGATSSYQVRVWATQTMYVLLHIVLQLDHGVLVGVVHSLIPLPDDPSHPPPPFVLGVDLDDDTLLYGYKPPVVAAATPATTREPNTHAT